MSENGKNTGINESAKKAILAEIKAAIAGQPNPVLEKALNTIMKPSKTSNDCCKEISMAAIAMEKTTVSIQKLEKSQQINVNTLSKILSSLEIVTANLRTVQTPLSVTTSQKNADASSVKKENMQEAMSGTIDIKNKATEPEKGKTSSNKSNKEKVEELDKRLQKQMIKTGAQLKGAQIVFNKGVSISQAPIAFDKAISKMFVETGINLNKKKEFNNQQVEKQIKLKEAIASDKVKLADLIIVRNLQRSVNPRNKKALREQNQGINNLEQQIKNSEKRLIDKNKTIGQLTLEQLKQERTIFSLKEKNNQMSLSGNFSRAQIVQGETVLGKNGFDLVAIDKSIQAVKDFAVVSATSMEQSAAISGNLYKAYEIGSDKEDKNAPTTMNTVVDSITKGRLALNMDADKYATVLMSIAPEARKVGKSIQEVSELTVLFNKVNIKGQDSITGLTTSFKLLKDPSEKAKQMLEGFGSLDAKTNVADMLATLAGKLQGLGTDDRAKAIREIFNIDDKDNKTFASMNKLLKASHNLKAEFKSTQKEMQQKGTTSENSKTLDDNIGGAITRLGGATSGLGEALFDPFKDSITSVVNLLADVTNGITGFIRSLDPAAIKIFGGALVGLFALGTIKLFGTLARDAFKYLGAASKQAGVFRSTYSKLKYVPLAGGVSRGAEVIGRRTVTGPMRAIRLYQAKKLRKTHHSKRGMLSTGIMKGLATGLKGKQALIGAAIVAVVTSLLYTFREALGINSPSKVFMEYGDFIMMGLEIGLTTGFGRVLTAMTRGAGRLIMASGKLFANLLRPSSIVKGFGIITKGLRAVGTVMRVVGLAMMANPIGMVIGGIALAAGLIYANWETVGPWFSNLWETVKGAFSSGWQYIKNLFLNYTPMGIIIQNWGGISDWIGGIWNSATEKLNIGWELVKQAFITYNPWSMITAAWGGISDWVGGIWNSVPEKLSQGWELIKMVFFNFTPLGLVISNWQPMIDWISGFSTQVVGFISSAWTSVSTLTSNTWQSAKQFVTDGIDGMINKVTTFSPLAAIQSAFTSVFTYFTNLPERFTNWGSMMMSGLKNGIVSGIAAVTNAISNTATTVKNKFKSLLGIKSPSRVFISYGGDIMKGLDGGMKRHAGGPVNTIENTGMALRASANDSLFSKFAKPVAIAGSLAAATAPALVAADPLARLDSAIMGQQSHITNNNQQYEIIVHAESSNAESIAQQIRQALHEHEAEKEFRLRTAAYDHQGGYA